jgi:putative toxin-antitoxin system antitoxin component (TIGR02293 family)
MLAEIHAPAQTPASRRFAASASPIGRSAIDARVIALLCHTGLRSQVRKLEKLELSAVWDMTQMALSRKAIDQAEPISALDIHRHLLEGLAGESLIIASSMFLNNLAEVEKHFGMSFKTIKARLGGTLDTATSEMAVRAARTTMTAAEVLGGYDAARAYMHTRNFALGGAAPVELIKTADGERIVLNELQTQAEGGPL